MRTLTLQLCLFMSAGWSCKPLATTPDQSKTADSLEGQGIQTATSLALTVCSQQNAVTTESALEAALRLINVGLYTHKNETQGWNDRPPQGGTHPYEWDSLRSANQMLTDRNGGSCGTHGLSIAAITRKAGVPATEIYVVGAVQFPDYRQICPTARRQRQTRFSGGQNGQVSDVHPANGHVFLLTRLSSGWHLFNSTHNPLEGQRFDPQNTTAACALKLTQFENVRFSSPEEIATSFRGAQPIQIPMQSFPSLVKWMQPQNGVLPAMAVFAVWKFEDYPKHTIRDRLNLVASGDKANPICRWTLADSSVQPQRAQNNCRIASAKTVSECYCRDGSVDRACYARLSR
jgi:hypothetical protein